MMVVKTRFLWQGRQFGSRQMSLSRQTHYPWRKQQPFSPFSFALWAIKHFQEHHEKQIEVGCLLWLVCFPSKPAPSNSPVPESLLHLPGWASLSTPCKFPEFLQTTVVRSRGYISPRHRTPPTWNADTNHAEGLLLVNVEVGLDLACGTHTHTHHTYHTHTTHTHVSYKDSLFSRFKAIAVLKCTQIHSFSYGLKTSCKKLGSYIGQLFP